MRNLLLSFSVILLTACISKPQDIQIVDRSFTRQKSSGNHLVKSGETLYSIAWRYGLDFRELSTRNHLDDPAQIKPGMLISLQNNMRLAKTQWVKPKKAAQLQKKNKIKYAEKTSAKLQRLPSKWLWPAQGRLISAFSRGGAVHNGIDISAKEGTTVVAAAPGKVVYSGSGLRGLGRLIIIKHTDAYLSAYAHNKALLVKEGDFIKAGAKIAEMGRSDTDKVKLHFEIRKNGQPINPMTFLRKR